METKRKLYNAGSPEAIVRKLIESGMNVTAPVRHKNGIVEYQAITGPAEIDYNAFITVQSAKKAVFPKVDRVLDFEILKDTINTLKIDFDAFSEQVLFGVKPCDAAGFTALKANFSGDYEDPFFLRRMEKTTVISFACSQADEYCFCTSVGGAPGNTAGSDIQLTSLGGSSFLVEIITEKGNKTAALFEDLLIDVPGEIRKEENLAHVETVLDREKLFATLDRVFESEVWKEQSLRCLGCGLCAFACPVCACFDIQDEQNMKRGVRLKLWDSCGFSGFTIHTSGHNPRDVQSKRWRQRIMHKFRYMPERLDVPGCTGCGRCSRICPADMNLKEHLIQIASL